MTNFSEAEKERYLELSKRKYLSLSPEEIEEMTAFGKKRASFSIEKLSKGRTKETPLNSYMYAYSD